MQGEAEARSAAMVSWAKYPSPSRQWVLDACYCHDTATEKPHHSVFWRSSSTPQVHHQQNAHRNTTLVTRHVCVIGAAGSGRSSILSHLEKSHGTQHCTPRSQNLNGNAPVAAGTSLSCCCSSCYRMCWEVAPGNHRRQAPGRPATCCTTYPRTSCRYQRIIDPQSDKYTSWYPRSHHALLTKVMDYVSTQAAAVVLVVSAVPVRTTATASYDKIRRQATALRQLLPGHIPILLAVTRSDLAVVHPDPKAAFCDSHWQQFLKMTGGKIPSGNIMCGCNEGMREEERQHMFATATLEERQQLLQRYKQLAASLGVLYLEVERNSASSMQRLWQKVEAVASDAVVYGRGHCNGWREPLTVRTSTKRPSSAAAACDDACASAPASHSSSSSSSSVRRDANTCQTSQEPWRWIAVVRAAIAAAAAAAVLVGGCEMLYDACGALSYRAEIGEAHKPRSLQAVLEVAGWVVLPLEARDGILNIGQ